MARKPSVIRNVEERMTESLIRYADYFRHKTGISDTRIGRDALNDPSFLHDIKSGKRRLSAEKYDQMVAFFDGELQKQEARDAAS